MISDDVAEKQFVCDLNKCKGGCCEDGEAGAPLADDELSMVVELYEKVKPYLTETSREAIEKKGYYVHNKEFGWVTPTLESDKEICAYGVRDKNGIIKCSFEQAYYDGVIHWKKPISCHLYPAIARKSNHSDYERINYEPRRKLCSPACVLGEKMKVPVYEFLKEPLVRKYGEEFYKALDKIARMKNENKQNTSNNIAS